MIYERLKHGSASEASRLLGRIRTEHGIPDLSEDRGSPRGSAVDLQLEDYKPEPTHQYQELQASSRVETAFPLAPASEVDVIPQWTGPIDPNLRSDLEEHNASSLLPTVDMQTSSLDDFQTSASSQRHTRSQISVSHRVLLWPEVVRHMRRSGLAATVGSDLQCLSRNGSPWLLQRKTSGDRSKLPCNSGLLTLTLSTGCVIFPDLTIQQVNEYSAAYFKTFNVLLPLLEADRFVDGAVARLLQEGYRDDDPESVLALLVLALGQLAIEGVTGKPTRASHDESSGFRGGSIERPPGLGLFNEARRRIGMINTQPCLETVQTMLLQATYFEASGRHLDFWTSSSAASLACTYLIRSQQVDWTSSYGDFVKRAYWVCVLHERLFDLEFRVISTSIESLEDQIPLPHFHDCSRGNDRSTSPPSDASTTFDVDGHVDPAFQFVGMITLSRLIRRADEVIHSYEPDLGETELLWRGSDSSPHTDASARFPLLEHYNGPPWRLIGELSYQLDCWRNALPQRLQWDDSNRVDFEKVEPLTTALHTSFFSPLRNLGPGELDHNVDIAVAQLRTRFYHARFLICRPFVYKALHLPELMTADDRIKCAFAIDAACLWPLSLAPSKNKKYLVPHLFSWTQNFVAMIVVLRMCRRSVYLADICKENGIAAVLIEGTISSMVEWLEDMRQVDGVADWGMEILGPAFLN